MLPPPYDPSRAYGMFGYAGFVCETALRNNDAELAEHCWRRGWWDLNTRMLIGTVLQECDRVAPDVAKALRRLGPTTCPPEMVP